MATSDITINGITLSSLGVTLVAGGYKEFLTFEPLKDFVENDDPLKPGVEVIVEDPVSDERDLTLTFLVAGADKASFLSNLKRFKSELHKGMVVLYIPDLGEYYHLIYRNATQFENYHLHACKLAIKFREPDPTRRTAE